MDKKKPRIRVPAGSRPMALGGAFEAARSDMPEFAGWRVSWGSADRDLFGERDVVSARARDLARNDALVAGAVVSKTDRAIGRGLALQSMPDAETLGIDPDEARAKAREIERIWQEWASDPIACDVCGRADFGQLTRLAAEQDIVEGEALAILHWRSDRPRRGSVRWATAVQVVDPARLLTPLDRVDGEIAGVIADGRRQKIVMGVEIDAYGAPVAYHIARQHPYESGLIGRTSGEVTRVRRFGAAMRPQVIHCYDIRRPGQHRGVSALAPVVRDLKMRNRYARAELQAAVVNAIIAAVIETPLDGATIAEIFSTGEKFLASLEEQRGDGLSLGVPPGGLVPELPPGQRLNSFATQRPNASFGDFMRQTAIHLAVGLNETPETLLRDFSKTTFSSARASLAEAWRGVMTHRWRIAQQWCRPVLEAVLLEAVLREYIDLPGFVEDRRARMAWMRGAWLGPARGWIDPQKEILAAGMAIALGLSTLRDEAMALGRDPDQLLDAIAAERAALAERGITLAAIDPLRGLQRSSDGQGSDPSGDQQSGGDA